MKPISIIWTRYTDFLAELVYNLTGRTYTHAAISLDADCAYYYSFCYKGFCRENVEKYRRRGVKSSLRLRLEVSDSVHEELKKRLDDVEQNADAYEYSLLGVFCALLHIPFRRRGSYYCSHFIAEILEAAGAAQLSRPACLCLPSNLLNDLQRAPGLVETAVGIV